ncbi:alpha-tocopherol transfer protein-like [Scaptodrosophila lebanonensis]|uniref:Alpha-tocopherol transfer protein-like n=1 Tax=Drosophila lebanonensis TaxID=7225 RepID=A0A6J2TU56_DROLE|nr:alpha-tocopherol transfer protein-like [Scaptodrosophila lebanonensis]
MAKTNSDDADISQKLQELQSWFETNPNLPENIEPIVLKRFLKCMFYDVEQTKGIIELNYSMRNGNPKLFLERNMEDEMTAKALRASDLLIMPGVTPERHKLILFRMTDLDPSSRNSVEESKIFFMMADARFTMPDTLQGKESESSEGNTFDDAEIADGDVQIVDINGYTMRHMARVSVFIMRVYMKFLQEAYPSRLRAMHMINCPPFLDRMVTIMKPFIREEVYEMIHFHYEGLDSLYECVPREMLPEEYGGNAGTIAEIKEHWLQTLREKSGYLSDEKYWKVVSQNKSRWSWF